MKSNRKTKQNKPNNKNKKPKNAYINKKIIIIINT